MSCKIFISYARDDEYVVRFIYDQLKDIVGYSPWCDVKDIIPGKNWQRSIYKAIEDADIFLAVLSENSSNKRGVIQKEICLALDKMDELLPDDLFIIPLRIDNCNIPERLDRFQVLDWDEGAGLERLFEAIDFGIEKKRNSSSSNPSTRKSILERVRKLRDKLKDATSEGQLRWINYNLKKLSKEAPYHPDVLELRAFYALKKKDWNQATYFARKLKKLSTKENKAKKILEYIEKQESKASKNISFLKLWKEIPGWVWAFVVGLAAVFIVIAIVGFIIMSKFPTSSYDTDPIDQTITAALAIRSFIQSQTPTRTVITPTLVSTTPITPTATPIPPTQTPTRTSTQTPSHTYTKTPSLTPTQTFSRTPTETPSRIPTKTPSRTLTQTPSNTPTQKPSSTFTQKPSRTPTKTSTPVPVARLYGWYVDSGNNLHVNLDGKHQRYRLYVFREGATFGDSPHYTYYQIYNTSFPKNLLIVVDVNPNTIYCAEIRSDNGATRYYIASYQTGSGNKPYDGDVYSSNSCPVSPP